MRELEKEERKKEVNKEGCYVTGFTRRDLQTGPRHERCPEVFSLFNCVPHAQRLRLLCPRTLPVTPSVSGCKDRLKLTGSKCKSSQR